MTQTAIDRELLTMENHYWQAIKDRDVNAALTMTDNPCIISGASGIGRIDHDSYVKIMEAATYELRGFKIEDGAQVRQLTPDVAAISYKVREDLMVDNKPVVLQAADTSIWVNRAGKWLCSVHTESVQGDAYGRDRQPNWRPT